MNARRGILAALPAAGAVAGLVFLGYVAAPHWDSVRTASRDLAPGWLLAAAAALVLHNLVAFAIWRGCLRATGVKLSGMQIADTYVPSLLARYVPGRVWSHGVRMALARRAGISMGDVTGAVGYEIILALASAGLVALVALRATAIDQRIRLAAVLLTIACVVVLIVARVATARDRVPAVLRRMGLSSASAGTAVLAWVGAANVLAWLVYGLVHWYLARAIAPVPLSALPVITGSVALAWIGGYLSVIMPAGIGVREGLLAIFLAPLLGVGPVVVLAATSRLLAIGLELLIFAGWSLWRFTGTRRGRPA